MYLIIGAVTSCVHVNVNGCDIGYSQDSKLPAEFNITGALGHKTDDAQQCSTDVLITLTVSCWCDGAFLVK